MPETMSDYPFVLFLDAERMAHVGHDETRPVKLTKVRETDRL